MAMINIYQAKAELSKLIQRACSGEEIVISKAGVPKVKLIPISSQQKRQPGLWKKVAKNSKE